MEKTLGIDLGTESARLAHLVDGEPALILNENRQPDIPAFIGFGKKGDILIGETARNRYAMHPESVAHSFLQLAGRSMDDEVFRVYSRRLSTPVQLDAKGNCQIRVGEKDFTPLDLLALFLYTLKGRAEKATGDVFSRAVISLPDHFGERQIAAVRLAASKAGLTPLQIVHQTSAAALEYAFTSLEAGERLVLVYSLGRVFDAAVIKIRPGTIDVLGSEGGSLLGSDFFSDQLAAYLLSEIESKTGLHLSDNNEALQQILRLAETILVALSSQLSYDIEISSLGKQEVNYQGEITREAFEQIIQPVLSVSISMADKALRQAGVTRDQIHTVLMTGAACQIPAVERELRQCFPAAQIQRPVNQKGAVALGTAVYTGLISSVTCEKCQSSNDLQQTVCAKCGAPLNEPAKMLCPACLSVENSGQETCAKCGYVFSGQAAPEAVSRPVGLPKKEVEQAVCSVQIDLPAGQSGFELELAPQQRVALPAVEGERVNLTELEWRSGVWRGPVYGSLNGSGPQHAGTLVILLSEARASADRLEVAVERGPGQEMKFIIRPARSAQVQYWQGQRGRWELNIYQRSHNQAPAAVVEPSAGGDRACREPNCAEEGQERCQWCGRVFCGQHLICTETGQQVCAACLEPVVRQVAASAARTGNLELLDRFIASLRPGQKNLPMLNLYLGLVKAQRGVFQEAVPVLEAAAPTTGADRRLIGQARLGRAKLRMEARDMPGVMQDLAAALTDDPTLQQANQNLDLMELQIYQMVESGQLAKAILELEKRRETNPLEVKLIHRLAILYYRLVTVYEEAMVRSCRGETVTLPDLPVESIERCWHHLIAYWGAVLFSRTYWQEWLEKRCAVSGLSVEQDVVDAVRTSFEERILQDVRNWNMEYQDAGQAQQAARLNGYDLLWEFELETARQLSEVSQEFRIPNWPAGFSCGTIMMQFLHPTPTGKPAVDGLLGCLASLNGDSGRKLQRYLTRLGRYHFLLDNNYYERVLVELEPLAQSPEARAVLGKAYCQRGAERLAMDDIDQGIADFEQARKNGADLAPYARNIAEAAIKRSQQHLADKGDPAYDVMIDLLERVRAMIGNEPDVCSNLAAALGQRARIANNAKNYPEAEKYLLRALAIDPNDKTIRHFTAVTYSNIAIDLLNSNQNERALDYLRRSLSYEDSSDVRDIIYNILTKRAVDYALARNRSAAITAMQEALKYDVNVTGTITQQIACQRLAVALINRGVEVANNNRYSDALNIFNEAKSYYDDPDIPAMLAVTYSRMDRKADAVRCWREAYQRNPGNSNILHSLCIALHNYGVELANADRYNDAINFLLEALHIENDPTTRKILAQVYATRGISRYKNGDRYGGRKDVEEALRYDPYNSDFRSILAQM